MPGANETEIRQKAETKKAYGGRKDKINESKEMKSAQGNDKRWQPESGRGNNRALRSN